MTPRKIRWTIRAMAPIAIALAVGRVHAKRMDATTLTRARHDAAWRPRQLVFNNDGDDHLYAKSPDAADFLANRTSALAGSHVSTIVYCTSRPFGMFTHNTKVGDVLLQKTIAGRHNIVPDLIEQGTDPLRVMIGFCRKNKMEIIWSMRMNDTHDYTQSPSHPHVFFSSFKRRHPECLLGSYTQRPRIGSWTAVDYGCKPVRDFTLRVFREICTEYDVDGIELDFFRHLVFFRSVAEGGTATDADRAAMTELVRRTRSMMDTVSVAKQRPLLLTVRVPDSVDYCRAIGLDVEQWLKEGLVDIMVAGGDFRLNPWRASVALGKRYDMPVWCDLDPAPKSRHDGVFNRNGIRATRGRAAAVWQAGAQAVYYFNWFDPHNAMWRETGDPHLLMKLPKLYFANVTGRSGYLSPGSCLLEWRQFDHRTQPHPDAPRRFAPDAPLRFGVEVGREKTDAKMQLHVLTGAKTVGASWNGVALRRLGADGLWQRFSVPGDSLHPEANTCELRLEATGASQSGGVGWELSAPAAVFGDPHQQGELFHFDPPRPTPGTLREMRDDALLIADRKKAPGAYLYCRHGWAAEPDKPAVVEVNVQVLSGRNGLIVANGRREERLWLYPDRLVAEFAKINVPVNLTRTFHTIRAEIGGADLHVSVDGKELLSAPGALTHPAAGARNSFFFGASMSVTVGEALWREVRYRTGDGRPLIYDAVLDVTP